MNRINLVIALLVLLLGSSAQVAADTINTISGWNGTSNIDPFGYPDTATYGQTITAPVDGQTQLNNFSFEMNLISSVIFQGYVYAWNGTQATGSVLYQSPPTHTASNGFHLVTFNTGGVDLSAGLQYVLFCSISNEYAADENTVQGVWGSSLTNLYSGGEFVFIANEGNTSEWTSTPWTTNFYVDPGDLAFEANFSVPTPEPSSLILFGIALATFLLFARGRRKV